MAQNTGTLVTAAIRPNDDRDLIASAFSNEVKGGHHMYALLSQRGTPTSTGIIEARREWGMLCTIYDDSNPDNNGTYQLVYGYSSINITDNNNWIRFSGSGQAAGEWISSVINVIDTPPGTTPSNGARYLIATPSFAAFLTQSNKIAVWSDSGNGGFGGWSYIVPESGYAVRSDQDLNVIYLYSGDWSLNNNWKKEYLTQVRYIYPTSTNGTTYSYTSSSISSAIQYYNDNVYYANFNYTNSGASTLNINGIGAYNMKKLTTGGLLDLVAGDIVPGVQYHLSWNSDNFMVHGLGVGGGGSAGVIGPAEDGSYEDGLYTDLTASTPVGVPIDRFNEILKALVPPQAPDLNSWSIGGPTFVTDGRLSFNTSTPGFAGVPGFAIGDLYSATTTRKGIISGVAQTNTNTSQYYQDITGQLNSGVSSSYAYDEYAFGNGITGSLVLKLNSVTVSSVDLSSTLAAIDTTKVGPTTGLTSGFVLSAATNSKFQSGTPFNLFWWRKGTYLIKRTGVRKGWNYLELSHILPSNTLTVASYSWVSDFSSAATSFTPTIDSITVDSTNGVKYLSGIKFWKTANVTYKVIYANHVDNTFKSGNALSAVTLAVSTSVNNAITNTVTNSGSVVMSTTSPISITTPSSPTSTLTKLWDFSLNNNVRRLNESISFRTSVERTVQGTDTSNNLSSDNWLIDNYTSDLPSDTKETFETEEYRLPNGTNKYETGITDTVAQITGTLYDSKISLKGANYTNQLQFINGTLIYPKYNFAGFGNVDKNPNFGSSLTNYNDATTSGAGHGTYSASPFTNNRTFTRKFRVNPNSTSAVLTFVISGQGFSFTSVTNPLSGNSLWIECKLPTDPTRGVPPGGLKSGGVTGWLDMTKPFDGTLPASVAYTNGQGAYTGSPTSNVIRVDFGSGRNTSYSNGYILLRITASPNWSGYIDEINVFPS